MAQSARRATKDAVALMRSDRPRSCQSDVSDHDEARDGTTRIATAGNPMAVGISRHDATAGDSRYERLTALAGRRTSGDGCVHQLHSRGMCGSSRGRPRWRHGQGCCRGWRWRLLATLPHRSQMLAMISSRRLASIRSTLPASGCSVASWPTTRGTSSCRIRTTRGR